MADYSDFNKASVKVPGMALSDYKDHLCLTAPKYKVWAVNKEYDLYIPDGAWDKAIEALNIGVEDCTDPECDWCKEARMREEAEAERLSDDCRCCGGRGYHNWDGMDCCCCHGTGKIQPERDDRE